MAEESLTEKSPSISTGIRLSGLNRSNSSLPKKGVIGSISYASPLRLRQARTLRTYGLTKLPIIFIAPFLRRCGQFDHFDRIGAELQPHRQQRAEGVVAAGARMKGMEEELRFAIRSRCDGCVAWRRPLPGGLEQRLTLLGVRPEHVVGDGDSNPVGRRRE